MSNIEQEGIASGKQHCNKSEILTIPNVISFLRIVFIAPFVLFFLNEQYIAAFSFIVLSGLSDCIDGYLARRLNQVTELGKILDPIADKLTLVAVIICLGTLLPQIVPLVIALVVKDLSMLLGGYYLIHKGIAPPAAKWYGKLATIIFYVSVVAIVFSRAFLHYNNPLVVLVLLSITIVAMMFALVNYAIIFIKLLNENEKKNKEKIEDENK